MDITQERAARATDAELLQAFACLHDAMHQWRIAYPDNRHVIEGYFQLERLRSILPTILGMVREERMREKGRRV